ncbi:MAG: type IV secretion system protein, partial [Burkholderiales bacterium]|nr:type IV secretion system protein [Burkholderiales bacterium]
LLMFPVTRPMFQGWFRSTLSFVFTIVILVAVIALFSETFNTQLDNVVTALKDGNNVKVMTVVTPVLLFCAQALTAGTVMKLVPAMASALVGGINMNAVGLGQMMMGAWGRGSQIIQATGNVTQGAVSTIKAGHHLAEKAGDLMNVGMSSALLAANQLAHGNLLVTPEQVKQLNGNVEDMQSHFTLATDYSLPVSAYSGQLSTDYSLPVSAYSGQVAPSLDTGETTSGIQLTLGPDYSSLSADSSDLSGSSISVNAYSPSATDNT